MTQASTILDRIIATKREEVAQAKKARPLATLEKKIEAISEARNFAARLHADMKQKGYAVIAEIKKASPSKGIIRENFDPVDIAKDYQAHGASALSVLTDKQYFQGSLDHLSAVHEAVGIPLLRKDFMVDAYQIAEARAFGASAILLIVAALDDAQLLELWQCARNYGLSVLVEVHDKAELNRALTLPLDDATLIGVNNRNLKTFEVSLAVIAGLHPQIPTAQIGICESGIHTREDVMGMKKQGIHAFLIGEAFMRQESPGAALQALFQD